MAEPEAFPSDPRQLADWLEVREQLDPAVDRLLAVTDRAIPPGPRADALHGVWLGHALHPLLTDLPIGFWTSSFVLDLLGRRARAASGVLVAAGLASAVPTVAAGLADWKVLARPDQRVGVVHAAANSVAVVLYANSLRHRLRRRPARGVFYGMAGAAAATLGGFLGGHLSYRRAASVNHATDAPSPEDWQPATATGAHAHAAAGDADDAAAAMRLVELDGAEVVVVGDDALLDRCAHLGGPLHEGEVVDGCVRCPWHGSTFALADGAVRRGPSTAPQPAYAARTDDDGGVQLRRKPIPPPRLPS